MQDSLLQPADRTKTFWRHKPLAWLREQPLTHEYWTFFLVAFFFDAGFAVYFFLFNLYLLDAHATVRTIGLINGATTLGSTLATLPAGILGRRFGVKPLLLCCLISAPILGAARILISGTMPQIVLAFVAGASMCLWGVAYLPSVARLTNDQTRASAYTLIFSASIVTSAIGGAVTSALPRWLSHRHFATPTIEIHRWILLASCLIAAVAIWPAMHLRLASHSDEGAKPLGLFSSFRLTPFLVRLIPCMALWTAAIGAFLPFANVYLVRQNFVTMQKIGLVFSVGQCLQLFLGMLTPLVLRSLGMLRGVLVIQLSAVLCLAMLGITHSSTAAICLYLLFSTIYWMCSPALYNLLMSKIADVERSHAAAMVMFLNALLTSATVAIAGASFTRFGFEPPILVIAAGGALIAFTLYISIRPVLGGETS